MFRKISLSNFKSFKRMDFNLTEGNVGKANNLALIYGANGSGKSSLVDAVVFLKLSTDTLIRDGTEPDLIDMACSVKNIGSKGNMKLEYLFTNGSEDGEYLMEFNDEGMLVREKLDYTINKNAGNIFELIYENGNISDFYSRQLFKNSAAKDIVEYEVRKQWGHNTFLSIVKSEMAEADPAYLDSMLGTGLKNVIRYIDSIIVCRPGYESMGPRAIDRSPEAGIITSEEAEDLKPFEEVASAFVRSIYDGVADLRYEISEEDGEVVYEMTVGKEDGSRIPLEDECQGIRETVRVLPGLLAGAGKGVAFLDNIEFGLHEVVLNSIFNSSLSNAGGQIVATTHDTVILENANPHSIFMAKEGKIIPITEIERTQRNHNNRNRYFKGVFGAIPEPEPEDLSELAYKYSQ